MGTKWSYRRKWLKWHKGYEKYAYKQFMQVFIHWTNNIPWSQLTKDNYKAPISNAFDLGTLNKAYYNVYLKIGLAHGSRVGEGINLGLKGFVFNIFSTWFERLIIKWLGEYGAKRIVTVRRSFFEYIVDIISGRLEKEKDFTEISEDIHKLVKRKDFYEWQALRIARTEATAAANYAASQAGNISGYVMVKEWISAQDNRTRRYPKTGKDGQEIQGDLYDHYHMNGKRVLRTDKFRVVSREGLIDDMEYPGDPNGEAGNVINCRCTVAVIPFRDKNGNLVPTN